MLGELVNLLGWEALESLARRLGGRRVYIPDRGVQPSIALALGHRSAAFHRRFSGCRVEIPTVSYIQRSRRQQTARRMLAEGRPAREVVDRTGLSYRTIRRLLGRMSSEGGKDREENGAVSKG